MTARRHAAPLALLLLAGAAIAEETPRVTVTRDPEGPVTVGTPVKVTATLLVPTFMPEPPVWPDLQIADAITRLPERATHPVTRRVGAESWSGLTRTWSITPQRAADFDLGRATISVTYADPETSQPVAATVAMPDLDFSATLPPGAEGMDPFIAATSLTVAATVDGLPERPKPGDAFTVTLTTTASGTAAMFLPPLAGRLPTLPGLRAYPRQPTLVDGDPASRTEAIAYVIEQPGSYALPAVTLDWWNTGTASRETAASQPVTIDVAAPAGWRAATARRAGWWALAIAVPLALLGGGLLLRRARRRAPPPPSARALKRALLRDTATAAPGAIRLRLADWTRALPSPLGSADSAAIARAFDDLERGVYGPGECGDDRASRRRLRAAISAARPARIHRVDKPLPGLNDGPLLPGDPR